MDKNQAIIDFLMTCQAIQDNPLFFNFLNAKDDNKQLVVTGNEKSIDKSFIDGSIRKRYTFTLIDYKSIAYQAIVNNPLLVNENVQEAFEVQAIIDWVSEQNDLRNFPDFGSDCIIEEMRTMTDNPNLNGVDTSITPALAKYSMSIQIDYIDTSKVLWNK